MTGLLWRLAALLLSRPAVASRIIARAQRTPYRHIYGPDGSLYMGRWWLFNPYEPDATEEAKRWPWLPSVRVHHIMRPDSDRHLHDHPWNARTVILRGFYVEERPDADVSTREYFAHCVAEGTPSTGGERRVSLHRGAGFTGALRFGQFHRITRVSEGGVFTLFFTWRKQGTWGFDVDGLKVPWREYLDSGSAN